MATRKTESGLTVKQEKFCKGIVDGLSAYEAYKNAYNHNGTSQTAYTEAGKLLLRDDIQNYIKTLQKPITEAYKVTTITERERKKQILWDIITSTDEKTENKLRAIDILNKMDLDYIEQQITENKDILPDLNTEQLTDLLKVV